MSLYFLFSFSSHFMASFIVFCILFWVGCCGGAQKLLKNFIAIPPLTASLSFHIHDPSAVRLMSGSQDKTWQAASPWRYSEKKWVMKVQESFRSCLECWINSNICVLLMTRMMKRVALRNELQEIPVQYAMSFGILQQYTCTHISLHFNINWMRKDMSVLPKTAHHTMFKEMRQKLEWGPRLPRPRCLVVHLVKDEDGSSFIMYEAYWKHINTCSLCFLQTNMSKIFPRTTRKHLKALHD